MIEAGGTDEAAAMFNVMDPHEGASLLAIMAERNAVGAAAVLKAMEENAAHLGGLTLVHMLLPLSSP